MTLDPFHLLSLGVWNAGVAREKYGAIKEGWLEIERASTVVVDVWWVGGGSGGGRMRRGLYGSISVVATRKRV